MRLLLAVHPPFFEQFIGDALLARATPLYEAVRRVDPAKVNPQEWSDLFKEFQPQAVVTGWITAKIPETAFPALKLVAHTAGGVRGLVDREMIEHGLHVTNWGPIAAPTVAEHALLLILSTLRRMTRWTLEIHQDKKWPSDGAAQSYSLYGRTVCMHGLGKIARQLAKLLQPFGCTIYAYSAGVPAEAYTQAGVTEAASLEDLFDRTDVFVEVEALTPETQGTVKESHLRRLKPGSCFVNVGRGAVIDEAALFRVAQEGKIQIGLDVLAVEPPAADFPLMGLRNVTLTPHIAGPTIDQRPIAGKKVIDNLIHLAKGEPLENLVTPDIYDRST